MVSGSPLPARRMPDNDDDQTRNSIWLLGDTTESLRTLEETLQQEPAPSWSADGQKLALQSDRGGCGRLYAVFVIDRDGT
jgi:Tol biopolymer transport system component